MDGPVGLLAGIIRRPVVLVYHFFAVAVLAMWLFVFEPEKVAQPELSREEVQGQEQEKEVNQLKETKSVMEGRGLDYWITIPWRLLMSWGVLWKACVVIFPYIFSELRS